MHGKPPCGFTDIAIAHFVDPLDMFPPDAICGHRVFRRKRHHFAFRQQRMGHVIGISGLGKIVHRADLDGGNGGCNRAVSGQNHDPAIWANVAQGLDHVKPVAVFKPKIDHGIGGRMRLRLGATLGHALRGIGLKATLFHCLGQTLYKWFVVIDQKQRAVRSKVCAKIIGHSSVPKLRHRDQLPALPAFTKQETLSAICSEVTSRRKKSTKPVPGSIR